MDSVRQANHFQKTFLPVLSGLLKEMDLPGSRKDDFDTRLEQAFCRSVILWCTDEPNDDYDKNLAEKIADAFGYCDSYTEPVKEAIRKARPIAQQSILEAEYRVVNDFGEAADYMVEFAVDPERRSVKFGVDTGMSGKRYSVFKLPYSDRIDFFFGKEDYYSSPSFSIGDEMKYLGFFDKETGILYDLREPLTMCWFHRPHGVVNSESSSELRKAIQRAFQLEIARRVAEKIPELPEVPPSDELLAMFAGVEAEYGRGAAESNFADKVDHSLIYIHANDPVRFIVEPEALIAERVDEYMKRYGDEVERRWISHLAARQILSYTAALGDAAVKAVKASG